MGNGNPRFTTVSRIVSDSERTEWGSGGDWSSDLIEQSRVSLKDGRIIPGSENPRPDATALRFDGSSDNVDFGSPSLFNLNVVEEGTFEIWAKPISRTSSRQQIWGDNGSVIWGIMFQYDSVRFFRYGPDGMLSEFTPAVGEWVHISIPFTNFGADMEFIINGSIDSRNTGSPDFSRNMDSVTFGQYANGNGNVAVTEARLWDYPREQSEVEEDYRYALNGNETGLVGYWPVNQTTGDMINDRSEGSNDGSINGAEWTTSAPDYSLD